MLVKDQYKRHVFYEESKTSAIETLLDHLIQHALFELSAALEETHTRTHNFGPRFVSGVAIAQLATAWAAA